MAKALHIPADSSAPISIRHCHTLDDWQEAVGGLIEPVSGDGLSFYANEEGLLLGLEFNVRGVLLARGFGIPTPGIVGDVIVHGPVDAYGHNTDVPDAVVAAAKERWGVAETLDGSQLALS